MPKEFISQKCLKNLFQKITYRKDFFLFFPSAKTKLQRLYSGVRAEKTGDPGTHLAVFKKLLSIWGSRVGDVGDIGFSPTWFKSSLVWKIVAPGRKLMKTLEVLRWLLFLDGNQSSKSWRCRAMKCVAGLEAYIRMRPMYVYIHIYIYTCICVLN